jgi:hypothetical protein
MRGLVQGKEQGFQGGEIGDGDLLIEQLSEQ